MCSRNFPEYFLTASIMVKETTEKFQFYFKIYHEKRTGYVLNYLRKQPTFLYSPLVFQLNDVCRNSTLFTCHYPEVGSDYDGLSQTKFASGNEKHHPVLRSDTSPVWNFYRRSSDVISRETIGVVSRPFSQATYFKLVL